MTKKFGIFGYPLSHTLSPVFHNAIFDYLNMDATYEAWEVSPKNFKTQLERLRGRPYIGANVTIPHKVAVMDLLDEIESQAKEIGSVNTILSKEGTLIGFNTDTLGLVRSLKEHGRFDPKGKNVLIVGAGGAARAAVFSLLNEGVRSIIIKNRTFSRSRSLANEFCKLGEITAVQDSDSSLDLFKTNIDLILNCSSVGMKNGPAEEISPLKADQIPSYSLVCDMVYNPSVTPLMRQANLAGASVLGGLPMLIYQGAASFELWTNRPAPIQVMFRAAEKALGY